MATTPKDIERAYEAAAFTSFFDRITTWQRDVAPSATAASTVGHLHAEIVELREEVWNGNKDKIAQELADLFILTIQCADRVGIDLYEATAAKMEENYTRRWHTPDAEGKVLHIKEGEV